MPILSVSPRLINFDMCLVQCIVQIQNSHIFPCIGVQHCNDTALLAGGEQTKKRYSDRYDMTDKE